MKIMSSYLVLVAVSCYVIACTRPMMVGQAKALPLGDYSYTSYDKDGAKVVEGRLSITSVESMRNLEGEDVQQIKGNWELKKVGNQEKIGLQDGSGDLAGSIRKGEIYINLNPNINDANVFLRGTIDGKRFHGKWTFSAYSGPVSGGTFEAIRK